MGNAFPQIEILPNQTPFGQPEMPRKPWYTIRRLLVFAVVFMLSALMSLAYVYSRPAQFRSFATLLTVAQTAIDQRSSEADVQHVAIQRQILMGQDLLDETVSRLNQQLEQNAADKDVPRLTIADIRSMLTVQAVAETNLVELAATGYQATILAPLIDTWIDVYLEKRLVEIRQTTGLTIDVLGEELAGLENKIATKRTELAHFREVNDITSLGRENIFENQSLARFRGLNKALNDASDEAVKAKARLEAVNRAIAQGKVVVPKEDKREVKLLELHLQELREQLVELDKKYTRQYLALNPQLNVLPQQIKELEDELSKKHYYGQSIVLAEAEQEYDAAQQSLRDIKQQLQDHKQEATEFSSKFSEHESLLSDLEGLELLQRGTQERLAQIEAKQAEKFPQVKVIERPFVPLEPFSPNYTRDAIIAIVGSIILSLLCVWIVEYLTRKEELKTSISISGANLFRNMDADLISRYQQKNDQITADAAQSITHDQAYKLEHNLLRELSIDEVATLLEAADIKGKQLISLLLSGLSLDEIARLSREDFDFSNALIKVKGENQRNVPLNAAITTLFQHIEPCPVWNKGEPVAASTLAAILVYATVDANLSEAETISVDALSHSYILFLVRQGVRLSDLEQIIGSIDPTVLSQYSQYSPEKRGLPMSDINLLYPALAKYSE